MRFVFSGSLILIALAVSSITAKADGMEFLRRVDYPVEAVFIPDGFDNNDAVQFVIHGNLPNSCYQIGYAGTELDQDNNKLFVQLVAYEYLGKCSGYVAPYHLVVHAGLFRNAGSYGVYDKKSGRYLGGLNISKSKPGTSGTDEMEYAPVLDGFLNNTATGKELVLRGVIPWSCLEVGDVKVLPSENVVVVLPELRRKRDASCVVGEFSYEVTRPVTETLPKAEYLLHIRSMGGQSVNKVVRP